MTTQTASKAPLDLDVTDPVGSAHAYVADGALSEDAGGQVGLELEFHLVDLARPAIRPEWVAVRSLVAGLPVMPAGSSVTLEPGGQIELSTRPAPDLASAVTALAADREALRTSLREAGFGAAPLGADPARPIRRTNPHQRYSAMEQHFTSQGCAGPGRAMMAATAALQVNLDTGPAEGWSARLEHIRALGPVLVTASASSPYLAGHSSGWHSMRQETWHGIDHGRSGPLSSGEPTEAWASYALDAPVMILRDGDELRPVRERVSFEAWLRQPALLGRRATREDLDYHLTTLFPFVRPRGYIEIRCMDALPDRWWPAIAAMAVTLIDDPVAADAARELCEPVAGRWEPAARRGPDDPDLSAAVLGCVELAERYCPPSLREEVATFAELISSGRNPSSELRARIESVGPLHVLEEEANA